MKVLLKEDVNKLGVAGDVVSVADGYARNYLIPQLLAVKCTQGQLKQVNVIRMQAQRKRDRIAAEHEAFAERLTGIVLTFEANASEKGRLYGSITRDNLAEALEARLGEPVDRRKIEIDPLRQIGMHSIPIRITAELVPEITAIVHREGEDPLSYLPTDDEDMEGEEETEEQDEAEATESVYAPDTNAEA
ncbi:MAG: 50S ribosomal protein L9 [Anaerolineales bacterium]|nr:50S ribosomal protein L9 [Anaerolineales bacterium]